MSRRYFRHGELPLVVLALLADEPRHGYEVMAELTRLFPDYRASPGSVYPAIEALQAEGLLVGVARDGKTTYQTTAAGDDALSDRAELLAAVEHRTGARLSPGDSLTSVLARFTARLVPLSGRLDPAAVEDVLERAAAEIEKLSRRRTITAIKETSK